MGRSRSDGPSGTKGSERHRSCSGERGRRDRGHGSERRHDSSRFRHSPRHRESGERARPTSSSGGSSSRSKQADSTDVPGSGRASGRATGPAFYFHASSASSRGHRLIIGPCPLHLGHQLFVGPCPIIVIMEDVRVWTRRSLGRLTCPDVMYSCLQSYHRHLRRELSQWSLRLPDQQGWTTQQVWRAWQTRQSWPTRQVWRARRTRQMTRTQQMTSQQGFTTRQRVMSPRLWMTRQVLPTCTWRRLGRCGRLSRSTGLGSWRLSKGWRACCPGYPSRDYSSCSFHTRPARTRHYHGLRCKQFDFPSLPRQINQTALLDFMSMMTLM